MTNTVTISVAALSFVGRKIDPSGLMELFRDSIRNAIPKASIMPLKQFSPTFSITNAITRDLTLIERARGFLEAAALSEKWIREMGDKALLKEAHYTTHIEGTKLTLERAERIWLGKRVGGVDPNDRRELLNYRRAFDSVSRYLSSGEPISEKLIKKLQKQLVEGTRGGQKSPGEYRATQNYVVNSMTDQIVYTPPSPKRVPQLMEQLVAWLSAEKELHPVLESGIAQFQLVHIHPFRDGNGRTSRLVSTLCLYGAGYDFKRLFSISEYYDRDRRAFYDALQGVRECGMDYTGWIEYFVRGLSAQLTEVVSKVKDAIQKDLIVRKQALSPRQGKIIEIILERRDLTIAQLEGFFPNVSRRTAPEKLKTVLRLPVKKKES